MTWSINFLGGNNTYANAFQYGQDSQENNSMQATIINFNFLDEYIPESNEIDLEALKTS